MAESSRKRVAARVRLQHEERTESTPARPRLRRKNLILDQERIDRARAVLGAATETEAITRALDTVLDLAAFRQEVDTGFAGLLGKGGFVNRFDDPTALVSGGFTATSGKARRK